MGLAKALLQKLTFSVGTGFLPLLRVRLLSAALSAMAPATLIFDAVKAFGGGRGP